jgi:hypothetical protein
MIRFDHITNIDSSHSSREYKSNYEVDIDVDKTCKSSLLNIQNEDDNLFNIQNTLFINYGETIYNNILSIYTEKVKNINFETFDADLWNSCTELHSNLESNKVKYCCFNVVTESKSKDDIQEMYTNLIMMKNKYKKIKLFMEISNAYINQKNIS